MGIKLILYTIQLPHVLRVKARSIILAENICDICCKFRPDGGWSRKVNKKNLHNGADKWYYICPDCYDTFQDC